MRIRSLLCCVALLSCNACATRGTPAYQPPPACPASVMQRCEPALADPPNPTLGDSEEVDAINGERWLRCIERDRGKWACLCALERAGYVQGSGSCGT